MEEAKRSGINNQELNNILLEDAEEPVSNSKKALMIGAALVVVFFVAIGIIRALSGGDDKNSNANMILPPEPAKKVDENPVFEKVPVKDTAQMDEKFDKIIKEIKEKTEPENGKGGTPNTPTTVTHTDVSSLPNATDQKGFVKSESRGFAPVDDQQVEEKKPIPTQPKFNQQPKTTVQRDEAPRAEPQRTVQKPTAEKEVGVVDVIGDDSVKDGYYIQVGAFYSLEPSQKLLSSIKDGGFKYTVFKTKVNSKDITKVIIGPYNSKNEAKDKLEPVREQINPSAYILKVR